MKIDFLIGDNPYATTTHFANGFAKSLTRQGCSVRTFYIGGGNFYKAFYAILGDKPDLTCSFSDITVGDKQPIGDAWGIPHLSILVDHAIYFLHQLQGKKSLIGSMDEEDVAYMQSQGFSNIFHLPHGVDGELIIPPEKKRSYDVVMLATCLDYERIEESWSSQQKKILKEAAERVLSTENVSCLRALLDLKVENDLPFLHQELEKYVKGKDRVEMARSLVGTDLHIWGNGRWKKYLPNAHIHRSVSYTKALEIMGDAKIVLNSAPCHKFSSHERIFQPFALGAVAITTPTSYVRKNFNGVISLESAKRLLSDEEKRVEIAKQGQQEIIAKHTWDQRALTLLGALEGLALD